MTIAINITKATIFIIAINYENKIVIFVTKKVIALTNIQKMSNKRKKNSKDKTKNFREININIIHFWPIIKEI